MCELNDNIILSHFLYKLLGLLEFLLSTYDYFFGNRTCFQIYSDSLLALSNVLTGACIFFIIIIISSSSELFIMRHITKLGARNLYLALVFVFFLCVFVYFVHFIFKLLMYTLVI